MQMKNLSGKAIHCLFMPENIKNNTSAGTKDLLTRVHNKSEGREYLTKAGGG